jgi:Cdc6-like AAA superfamily ATPase
MKIKLRSGFRATFRALSEEDIFSQDRENGTPFYIRLPLLREQIKKFVKSEGGCILICGHMGVGKTSLINSILGELKKEKSLEIVDIRFNLARPISSTRLKFKILRSLYRNFLAKDEDVYKQIEIAYLKTLYRMKETVSEKKIASVEAGIEGSSKKSFLSPKLSLKSEKNSTRGLELALGEYGDIEAEEDIEDIIQGLAKLYDTKPVFVRVWQRISRSMKRTADRVHVFLFGKKKRLKLVVVLDELDKLDKQKEGKVEELIESLKNIFTTSNTSFILISGHKTLNDVIMGQNSEIDSVFSGIISDTEYIPCLWDEIRSMAHWAVDEESIPSDVRVWYKADFIEYLVFVSRGNLRQFIRTVISYKSGSYLEFSDEDQEKITAMAHLQRFLNKKIFIDSEKLGLSNIETDYRRLEVYRIIDYIVNLNPGDELTVIGNAFSHNNSWFNHKIPSQTAKFGVKLPILIKVLEDLGYLKLKKEV